MAVESIGTVAGGTAADTKQLGIGQEDFLKILLTQLTYQDPLKPMDNQEFIAQMAQFTSLEQTRQLNDGLENLLKIQSATQSVGLIGKTVEVRTASGSEVGQVTTVTFQNGSPTFVVKTQSNQFLTDITLSQVFVVRE